MNFTVPLSYNADLEDSKSSRNPVFFCKTCNRFSLKRFGERTDSVLQEPEPEELSIYSNCFVKLDNFFTAQAINFIGASTYWADFSFPVVNSTCDKEF